MQRRPRCGVKKNVLIFFDLSNSEERLVGREEGFRDGCRLFKREVRGHAHRRASGHHAIYGDWITY